MTFEEAFAIVTAALAPRSLSDLQTAIFQGTWNKQSYHRIARELNHEYSYIKDIGAGLWQILSQAFGIRVTKLNLQEVLSQSTQPGQKHFTPSDPVDWGEALNISQFYGREAQLTTLEQWVVQDDCRLVAIVGMGGIGKTTLVTKLTQQLVDQFEIVIWRSLQQAPPILNLLEDLICTIRTKRNESVPQQSLPLQLDELLRQLLEQLRSAHCLLILDQVEAVLSSGELVGNYRSGYEDYRWLFDQMAQGQHQSSILLTSRETPVGVATLAGSTASVRLLRLKQLSISEGEAILVAKELSASTQRSYIQQLIKRYQGNPFMLKSVATLIDDLYDSNIAAFLAEEALLFKDIRDLIAQQFDRLSSLERQVMYWLALNQEPMSATQLQANLLPSVSGVRLRDALISLDRRSLIEKIKPISADSTAQSPLNHISYTQQPVVMEYIIELLNDQICQEVDQVHLQSAIDSSGSNDRYSKRSLADLKCDLFLMH